MEPESSQPVPVEEADHYAGHKEFNQEKRDGGVNEEKGEGFDLNNYIEKISDGANIGKFQCNICGYVASVYNVKRHVESKHFPGVFEYSCDQCEENFNTKSKLQNHLSTLFVRKKTSKIIKRLYLVVRFRSCTYSVF